MSRCEAVRRLEQALQGPDWRYEPDVRPVLDVLREIKGRLHPATIEAILLDNGYPLSRQDVI